MPPYRLAHLSDPHLPPPPGALTWRDLASKRALSAIAWRRKGPEHRPDVLAALIADVRAQGCDHTAITGDLTNFSTPAEYAAARAWLQTLGDPRDLTLSPGNHDALVGADAPARFAPWREWLGDADDIAFPALRERGPLALINLCSAIPTAPWLAAGRLGADQLARLTQILDSLAGRDLRRVVTIHHPPSQGVVSGRKSLEDAADLRAILARHGVDLILHGHAHEAEVSAIPGPSGPIPVLGVPSASAAGGGRHAPARWHALEFPADPADRRIRVEARGLVNGAFAPLGAYVLGA
ncbi:metallophosphoesterase [Phenylobacterium sp.]|uniref:metallophosphoesterase family protein n=1 Tax=Phenylobacterium sp. TaxID=1871053 RepID=UPI00286B00CE|nr:metallophosphoesterase [Phenylobacterium sp.]